MTLTKRLSNLLQKATLIFPRRRGRAFCFFPRRRAFWAAAASLAVAAPFAAFLTGHAPSARAQNTLIEPLLQDLKVVEEGGRKVVEVTLRDILLLALKRSNPLKVAKISEEIAQSRLAASRNRHDPTLTSAVSYGRTISPFTSSTTLADGSSPFLWLNRNDGLTISSEVNKKTSSGISYGLKFQETSTDSETFSIASAGDSPAATGSSSSYSSTALTGSVSIPIYQDYGTELDEIPERQSEIGIQRSRLEIRRDTIQVLGDIAGIYWDLVDLRAQVKVAEDSVRLSERFVEDNQRRVTAGVLSPADVAVSEAQLARERQNLLEFQLAALRIEDQVRGALNLEQVELGYRPVDEPTLRETQFDFDALAKRMFERDPRLGILESGLESNSFELLEVRNKDKTNLDVDLFYVFHGYDSSPLGGISGFSETDLGGYGAALTWTLPLFDHDTQQNIQQKMLERKQIELRIKDQRSTLTVRLQSALRSLRLARKEVETARIAQSLAEKLRENETERFRLGRSTSFRVAQFQQDADTAQRREITARVRYERTFLDMLVVTGDIFQFYDLPDQS